MKNSLSVPIALPMRAFFLCAALAVGGLRAESAFSDLLVRQRWPWSEKVDVDFTLTGTAAEVDVYATWDALRADGVARILLGTLFDAQPGVNRFTWDPSASVWADRTLTGFSVSLDAPAADAHTYLVVDLRNGGVCYRAAPDGADGAWSDAYKTVKMAFRRIPAGTYALGEPADTFSYLGANASDVKTYYKIAGTRTVTFTHDFYVGVFRCTTAQAGWLAGDGTGGDTRAALQTYDAVRGAREADGIDWPLTRYAVAPTSVVARLRARAGGAFTVDLCEDEQWEVAARAGTNAFWSAGGTTNESYAVLSNRVNAVAAWRGNGYAVGAQAVGQKAPNAWGLYDIVGGGTAEWVLDSSSYFNSAETLPTAQKAGNNLTDPVGTHSSSNLRVYRGHSGFGTATTLLSLLPCMRRAADSTSMLMGFRFCIHLRPLAFP